jgi:hypothetical protein
LTRPLPPIAFILLAGCTPGPDAVRASAERDLPCPASAITVALKTLAAAPLLGHPDDVVYEAKGCGKRAEYWVKDRELRPHHGEWFAPRAR